MSQPLFSLYTTSGSGTDAAPAESTMEKACLSDTSDNTSCNLVSCFIDYHLA